MTLAQQALCLAAGASLLFVVGFAAVVYAWSIRSRRYDPHREPHGDIPFIPSAGVALRPDAGGRRLCPPRAVPSVRSSLRGRDG